MTHYYHLLPRLYTATYIEWQSRYSTELNANGCIDQTTTFSRLVTVISHFPNVLTHCTSRSLSFMSHSQRSIFINLLTSPCPAASKTPRVVKRSHDTATLRESYATTFFIIERKNGHTMHATTNRFRLVSEITALRMVHT